MVPLLDKDRAPRRLVNAETLAVRASLRIEEAADRFEAALFDLNALADFCRLIDANPRHLRDAARLDELLGQIEGTVRRLIGAWTVMKFNQIVLNSALDRIEGVRRY
jgi:hypothetical protein